MTQMPAVLSEIVEHKRAEVRAARAAAPLDELRARAEAADPPRDFLAALAAGAAGSTAVIAEVKRRSPSAGLIRPEYEVGFDPALMAQRYHANGASAISCLTDEKFFGGSLDHLRAVVRTVPLPILRKDFIIDPWQVWESRAAGADAILLIAECLDDSDLAGLHALARALGMSVLLEVHGEENAARALPLVARGGTLLGINNRNLSTMATDVRHTLKLVERVADRGVVVSESGIRTPADLALLRSVGVRMVLVGEHLMRQADPGRALAELLGRPPV